jgi:hypothetical protein
MKKIFLLGISLLNILLVVGCQSKLVKPKKLRTDLLRNSDHVKLNGKVQELILNDEILSTNKYEISKIQTKNPIFNWVLDDKSKQSTSYQLLVSSSIKLLNKNKGDLWDSGKINSNAFSQLYNGKELKTEKVYYWKIRYWEKEEFISEFSEPKAFVIDQNYTGGKFSQETLFAIEQKPTLIKKNNTNYFIDFEKAAFSKLKIRLNSSKNDSVRVAVGEMKIKDYNRIDSIAGRNIRYYQTLLKLNKGSQWYEIEWPNNPKRARNRFMIEMPNYIGEVYPFRYLEIEDYEGNLTEDDIIRTDINYSFDENASSFISSDSILNQVWDLCKYSMKATSFCGYYVDGDRERIPYEADAFINQLSHYAVDAEYSISRGSMKHLLFNPTWPTEWTLYNILMAWYDYLYTGDDRFIVKYYEELKIKTLLDLADETGLISTLTGKQTEDFFKKLHKNHWGKNNNLRDIVDWPQAQPPGGFDNLTHYIGTEKEYPGENDGYVYQKYNAVVNALFFGCLKIMEKIALDLSKVEDALIFKKYYERVKIQYLKTFQEPYSGLINDGQDTEHKSQHANMFALSFGLIPEKNIDQVVKHIISRGMSCSVYGSQILLESLFENGASNEGIKLMAAKTERSWYNMIRYGSTITMEAWDKRYKPNLDLNHAWGGAPANIIVRKMMGVEPISPGAKKIKIHPKIGDLNFAKLKTSFISGEVLVSCKQDENSFTLEVEIPGGVEGYLVLPANKGSQRIYHNGNVLGLKTYNNKYHLKQVYAGKHLIEIK